MTHPGFDGIGKDGVREGRIVTQRTSYEAGSTAPAGAPAASEPKPFRVGPLVVGPRGRHRVMGKGSCEPHLAAGTRAKCPHPAGRVDREGEAPQGRYGRERHTTPS